MTTNTPSPATVPHTKRTASQKNTGTSTNNTERKFTRNSRKRLTHRVADSLTTQQIVLLAIRYGGDPSQHPSRRKPTTKRG